MGEDGCGQYALRFAALTAQRPPENTLDGMGARDGRRSSCFTFYGSLKFALQKIRYVSGYVMGVTLA
jgi:hypothetical protein